MSDTTIQKEYPTKEEAEAEGQRLCDAWGWGYNPQARVWQSGDVWVMHFTRWDSCD